MHLASMSAHPIVASLLVVSHFVLFSIVDSEIENAVRSLLLGHIDISRSGQR
jgi:hypothetical protein